MSIKKILILPLITVLFNAFASGQETSVKKDSTRLYKDIETFSKRNKFNTFIYRLIFKPIATSIKKSHQKESL